MPHPSYYIYCRNSLDASEFKRKASTAKLIILDDVRFIGNDVEMWKALISGEELNINTKYHNYFWKGGLPCIVMTNDLSTTAFWTSSPMFNTQCCFVNIRDYMGPPGTRPSFLDRVECYFDDEFSRALAEEKDRKKRKDFLQVCSSFDTVSKILEIIHKRTISVAAIQTKIQTSASCACLQREQIKKLS